MRRLAVILASAALLVGVTGATAGNQPGIGVPSDAPTDQDNIAAPVGPTNPGIDNLSPSPVLEAVVLLQSIPQGGGKKPEATQRKLEQAQRIIEVAQRASTALVRRDACYVPFTRTLRYGSKGRDVLALKYALRRAGYQIPNADQSFGSSTRTALRKFQRSHDVPISGVYGLRTHKALDCAYGPRAKRMMYQKQRSLREYAIRLRIRAAAIWGYEQRDKISYSQGIYRMRDFNPPPNVPNATDCSGFASWSYKSSGGAKDPNCRGWDGYGWTGTMLACGRRIFLNEVEIGDLVFYSGHVAIYVGRGRVVSLGSSAGPLILPIAYRAVYQVRTYF